MSIAITVTTQICIHSNKKLTTNKSQNIQDILMKISQKFCKQLVFYRLVIYLVVQITNVQTIDAFSCNKTLGGAYQLGWISLSSTGSPVNFFFPVEDYPFHCKVLWGGKGLLWFKHPYKPVPIQIYFTSPLGIERMGSGGNRLNLEPLGSLDRGQLSC